MLVFMLTDLGISSADTLKAMIVRHSKYVIVVRLPFGFIFMIIFLWVTV